MTYSERKEKEKHLIYLIEQERLRSLEKVANDYECSVRTIKRMIASLREEGYNIYFCRVRYIYYIKNS
ncbi:HTH domain-containing protein [Flavivirga jejuensis]|uniref:HTH domain-containing protein n=1 Tax=Flavivirga jejuensis TaxID=870487 RepID=UPI003371917C